VIATAPPLLNRPALSAHDEFAVDHTDLIEPLIVLVETASDAGYVRLLQLRGQDRPPVQLTVDVMLTGLDDEPEVFERLDHIDPHGAHGRFESRAQRP
jgi:hypothetical protein